MKRMPISKQFRSAERWSTRYGNSVRLVTRDANGRFVDNISVRPLGLKVTKRKTK